MNAQEPTAFAPTMVYKCPGHFTIPGTKDTYKYVSAKTQEELDHLLASGWFEGRDAAVAARKGIQPSAATSNTPEAASAAADDAAPPTRAELEQKATELGLQFNDKTKDDRLAKMIAKAIGG